jgi:hypothetical protein
MFDAEMQMKIQQLEKELARVEEEYVQSIRTHHCYNTLRALRTNMSEIKKELYSLHDQVNPNRKE